MKNCLTKRFLSGCIGFSILFSTTGAYPIFGLFRSAPKQQQQQGVGLFYKYGFFFSCFVATICLLLLIKKNNGESGGLFRFLETAAAKKRRLLSYGIPEHIVGSVKKAKKVENITYVQLETVYQFSSAITGALAEKHKAAKEENRRDNRFDPRGTCPIQAIRNAYLMNEVFRNWDNQEIVARYLERINSDQDASNYLKNFVDRNRPTSWLQSNEIDAIIREENLGAVVKSLDTVLSLDLMLREYRDTRIFVVNEDDISAATGFVDQICKETKEAKIYQKEELEDVDVVGESIKESGGNSHWYLVAMRGNAENAQCYIIDTFGNDHISTEEKFTRNRFLCEKILTGRSSIDYRERVKQRIADMVTANANIK